MRTPPRELITAAFGLSAPAEMVPVHFGTTQTWSLDTVDGRCWSNNSAPNIPR